MNQPKEPANDSFEESLRAAHSLMRQRKGEEACRLLFRAKEEALSSGANDQAALYSSVRGSYLAAQGRDVDALEAYQEAEQLSGSGAHDRLITARHLVVAMDRPGEALEVANELVGFESDDPTISGAEVVAIRGEARAIRGLALLSLDQLQKAIEELRHLHLTLAESLLHPLSCDLTLVEMLARQQLAPQVCLEYLDMVGAKAKAAGEGRVLDKVEELRGLVSSSGRSSEM